MTDARISGDSADTRGILARYPLMPGVADLWVVALPVSVFQSAGVSRDFGSNLRPLELRKSIAGHGGSDSVQPRNLPPERRDLHWSG